MVDNIEKRYTERTPHCVCVYCNSSPSTTRMTYSLAIYEKRSLFTHQNFNTYVEEKVHLVYCICKTNTKQIHNKLLF